MSKLYNLYLSEHISNVCKGLNWIKEHIPSILDPFYPDDNSLMDVDLLKEFSVHDSSKVGSDEYEAYDNYFYGKKTKETIESFEYAWLHHIHRNPHHWQYWVLINGWHKAIRLPTKCR